MEIEQEDLETARKLFEEAASADEAERAQRKATEELRKALEARDRALERHRQKIRAAEEAKVRSHAAVTRARKAQREIKAQFVDRALVLEHEQAGARWRELEQMRADADRSVSTWRREIEALVARRDLEPEDREERRAGFERKLSTAEAEAAKLREELAAQLEKVEAAAAAVDAAIGAVYELAHAGAPANKGGKRGA